MLIKRDSMVHIEATKDASFGGALCITVEEEAGQYGLGRVLEIGPFDTALDVAVWIRNQLVDAGLLAIR